MKKLTFIFLLWCNYCLAQDFSFAWLSELNIGAADAGKNAAKTVHSINSRDDLAFVIVTGNLTAGGSAAEYQELGKLISSCNIPVYVLPGKNECRTSSFSDIIYKENIGNENFSFDYNGKRFIGLNTFLFMKGSEEYISPENLQWLKEVLDSTDAAQEIYFVSCNPLDSITANWYMAANLLQGKNVKALLSSLPLNNSSSVIIKNGFPSAYRGNVPETDQKKKKTAAPPVLGYTTVTDKEDSIYFFENIDNGSPLQWGTISKTSAIEYSRQIPEESKVLSGNVTIRWNKNLNSFSVAPVSVYGDRLFAASKKGIISCFDIAGNLKWDYDTGGSLLTSVVRDGDIAVVSTYEGDLFLFNANNGKVLQVLSTGENLTSALLKYDIDYGNAKIRAILTGTASGKILCYNMYSLEQVWENSSAKNIISCTPLLIDGRIVYSSGDGYLYNIDSKSGVLNWKWQNNPGSRQFQFSNPVSNSKFIFIRSSASELTAVDLLLGITSWKKTLPGNILSAIITKDKNNLLVQVSNGKLLIISPSDGKIITEINIGNEILKSAGELSEWEDSILFTKDHGTLAMVDASYKVNDLFFAGSIPLTEIKNIKDNLFVVSNAVGNIILIELNK